ncbi:MAG: hypothetical protein HOP00_05250 [Nitrospira sp.]|nr:hypothetical protein [Nitrospira sp.]
MRDARLYFDPYDHNALLLRAREVQGRIFTLLVRWYQTTEPRYREAAFRDLRALGAWEHWSWDASRRKDADPKADFDLSYGENCFTLAFAYDCLRGTLSDAERNELVSVARRRGLDPFLFHTEKGNRLGWWGAPDTNWNAVCAGGAGMLAIALGNDDPVAAEALHRAEQSVGPFFAHLQSTHGACPEGLAYWNYGMRYATYFVLSLEAVRGRPHPWLETPQVAATVDFPLHFSPFAATTGFGDINTWVPLPFHYALAGRFNRPDVVPQLDRQANRIKRIPHKDHWAYDAEMLLLHPGATKILRPKLWTGRRHYPKVDWGVLADRWPQPRLYASIRGGSTAVPHSHLDLLSFHLVSEGRHFIDSCTIHEYLDTSFSERRWELFETAPAAKNTLLVNGLGITSNSMVNLEPLDLPGATGFRMDATQAMGRTVGRASDRPAVEACVRAFLHIPTIGLIVIDTVRLLHPGRVEARFHTPARIRRGRHRLTLSLGGRHLRVTFASNVPADVFLAHTAPTLPTEGQHVFRWCTLARAHTQVLFATLFSTTAGLASIKLDQSTDGAVVSVLSGKRRIKFKLDASLKPCARQQP